MLLDRDKSKLDVVIMHMNYWISLLEAKNICCMVKWIVKTQLCNIQSQEADRAVW